MARSTPAQNPRGLASTTSMTAFYRDAGLPDASTRKSPATPPRRVIAESATLNAGNRNPIAIVYLYKIDDGARVHAVYQIAERAGQITSETGSAVFQSRRGVAASTNTVNAMLTSTANAVNSQRCQPGASARKLNAAPVLNASVQFKNPGITSCGTYGSKCCSNPRLLW